MQGTLAMLLTLGGMGCWHKSCDVAYMPSCYSSVACYDACYSTGYSGPVYGAPVVYSGAPIYASSQGMATSQSPVVASYQSPASYVVGGYGCYTGYSGCYSGGYGGCYGMTGYGCGSACYDWGSSCYNPCGSYSRCGGHGGYKRGLFGCLFGGFKPNYGGCCGTFPAYSNGCYAPAVYGSYTSASYGTGSPYGGQVIYTSPQGMSGGSMSGLAPISSDVAPANAPPPPNPVPAGESKPFETVPAEKPAETPPAAPAEPEKPPGGY